MLRRLGRPAQVLHPHVDKFVDKSNRNAHVTFFMLIAVDDAMAEKFKVEVGKNIRRARQNATLRQEDLAEALHVDQGRISLWENGKALPGLLQLAGIALTCRRRPEALIEGIVAPSFEQLGLRMDARSSELLYEIAALIVDRGAPEESQSEPAEVAERTGAPATDVRSSGRRDIRTDDAGAAESGDAT